MFIRKSKRDFRPFGGDSPPINIKNNKKMARSRYNHLPHAFCLRVPLLWMRMVEHHQLLYISTNALSLYIYICVCICICVWDIYPSFTFIYPFSSSHVPEFRSPSYKIRQQLILLGIFQQCFSPEPLAAPDPQNPHPTLRCWGNWTITKPLK